MKVPASALFAFAQQTALVYSKILSSPLDLSKREYDFVVIGAGTAGSVIASRLTEDPHTSVLVVEAGISHENIFNLSVPFLSPNLVGTLVDWNYTTIPLIGLNNRSIGVPRGFVLGGTSSINRLVWNRGSNDVWDNWANLTNDQGWSWNSVEPFYLKSFYSISPPETPAGHGPIQVSVSGYITEVDKAVISASKSIGGRFGFTEDLNTGKTLGFTFLPNSVGNGERSSAATAYLEPILKRPNLDVLITTQATKLIPSPKTANGLPVISTVEIAQASDPEKRFLVHASKEVILSAGSIGTPQILLLSGIGSKQDLKKLNISSLVDLPDVGQNLGDHPLVSDRYQVHSMDTFDDALRNNTVFEELLDEWITSRQGLFVDTYSSSIGFFRFLPNATIFQNHENPASGPFSANVEILFQHGWAPAAGRPVPLTGNYITMVPVLVSSTSRGSVKLSSTNPFDHPIIDTGLLANDFDIQAMFQSLKDSQQFIKLALSNGFILRQVGDFANTTTDESKINVIRNTAASIQHPLGTARMSPKHASWGVTDPDLRVKGVSGLRIVDGSIFPQIPECHPQALVYAVAERASQLIKQAHGIV